MKAPTVPTPTVPDGRYLPERDGHRVWWCETGLPEGTPVLVLHGGPGGRTRAAPFAWFDGLPARCIAFDQRGCGQSTPAGGLEHNTLAHLVDDIERLREQLAIATWGVVAGSWGALVAVAYAAAHPQRVRGLFLRSSFLGSDSEVARFFQPWSAWLGDAGRAWLGAQDHADPVSLLGRMDRSATTGSTQASSPMPGRVALAWQAFEAAQARPGGLSATPLERFKPVSEPEGGSALPPGLAVQLHYLQHHCFVGAGQVDEWLRVLDASMQARPVALVHGLADAVCRADVTAALSARWPAAYVRWVADAGHDMDAPPMRQALTQAAEKWCARLGA